LGLPEGSKRRRCLLVEATQLAWAANTSIFSPINRGRRGEQIGSALMVLRNLSKLVRNFHKRFRGDSSPFFIHSSSFFGLQPVSSRNRIFQFILCTLSGPYLFCVLLLSLRLFSVPFLNEFFTVYLSRFSPNK